MDTGLTKRCHPHLQSRVEETQRSSPDRYAPLEGLRGDKATLLLRIAHNKGTAEATFHAAADHGDVGRHHNHGEEMV